jgi:hypothetical protein
MAVIAPTALNENTHVPYVTIDEVLYSPTASSIDFSNLIENGSEAVQRRALQELITRASVKADNFIYGAMGTLTATVNTENGRYRANRLGQFIIHPYCWPILEVRTFKVGYGPGSAMTTATVSADTCAIERFQFIMTNPVGLGSAPVQFNTLGNYAQGGSEQFVEYTYVNGFANTFTTADANVGATSIQVTSAIGIYPGLTLTIWDGMNDETVTVASSYDGSSLTLPLTSALQYNHGKGVSVSNLPATVKQAVIHLVVALVKQRGQGGLVLNELGDMTPAGSINVTSQVDEMQAYDLLTEFQQIWGRI